MIWKTVSTTCGKLQPVLFYRTGKLYAFETDQHPDRRMICLPDTEALLMISEANSKTEKFKIGHRIEGEAAFARVVSFTVGVSLRKSCRR